MSVPRAVRETRRLNALEEKARTPFEGSWHQDFAGCPYVCVRGFPPALTEGDLLMVFSQFGEIDDINLVRRDGQSSGVCFLGFRDWRSTALAVDNMSGATLADAIVAVTHVKEYRRARGSAQD